LRKLAPTGASSRSRSPSANAPWHSEQPAFFQAFRPAFTRASSCANPGDAWSATVDRMAKAQPARTAIRETIGRPACRCCARSARRRFVDLDPRRALEQILGRAVLVRVDRVLAGFVVAARFNAIHPTVSGLLAHFLGVPVVDRPLALGQRQIVAGETETGDALEQVGEP